MLEKRQPRHILRAQGRAQLGERVKSEPLKDKLKYTRLLDYLSQSAAGSNRTILDHATTDAVVSSSSAAQLLEAWFARGSNATDIAAEGEDIDGLAATDSEGYWPAASGSGSTYSQQDELDLESNQGRYPGNYSGGYFGTESASYRAGASGQSRRVQREIDGAHGEGGPGAYLRSLRALQQGAERSAKNISADSKQSLSRCGSPVQVTEEAGGSRVETFPTGARVLKDGLGHVREIVSAGGVTVMFKYDDKGHLSAFIRTDARGTIHSLAEADRNGVILRDAGGRVKAQGESMQVDACGCVSIARQDGQFWSLDLVRNVNIERRLLPDEHGNWFSMTALFSSDGFRMATRFRKVKPEDLAINQHSVRAVVGGAIAGATSAGAASVVATASGAKPSSSSSSSSPSAFGSRRKPMVDGTIATLAPGRIDFLSEEDSGNYRFYGRDGSIIDFASDDELKQLKPSCVMPAASRRVEAEHRGKRQAGTAWEALREYVFNYLAAL
ncbi:MAG: hypothetical protein KGS72_19075 [Cyanobacteria bacterium REEB67]|nr:hypothetical protein [Cyanobacteria bacterium REEB67]